MSMTAALKRIADMDPEGIRADDLGRAALIAREALASSGQAASAVPTEPGWYVVLPPDFDEPTVRAFGKDGQWWIPLGRGDGADGWMSGREYKNWVGPIADIDASQPFLASPTQPASAPAAPAQPREADDSVSRALEWAEYLARDAENFLAAVNEQAAAAMAIEESTLKDGDPGVDELCERQDSANESYAEHMAHLRSGIYEFRKRAARALSTPPAPRAPSIEPVALVNRIRSIVDLEREPHWAYRNTMTTNRNAIRDLCDQLLSSLAAPAGAGVEEFPLPEARETAEPVAYWIPKAEQFCLPPKDGTRPFAKAWEPLYTAPVSQAEPSTSHEEKGLG